MLIRFQWCVFFILNVFCHVLGPYDKDEIYDPRPQTPVRPYYPPPRNGDYRPDQGGVQQYKAAVGDGTKLSCEIENYNKRTSWRRQDGRPLPSNARLSGGDLVCFPNCSIYVLGISSECIFRFYSRNARKYEHCFDISLNLHCR